MGSLDGPTSDTCGHVCHGIADTVMFCRRPVGHGGGHSDGTAWWTVKPSSPEANAEHETCRRCYGPNVAWSAASPLWNFVMRGNDINGAPLYDDLVCLPCFVELAVEAGLPALGWRLTLHPEPGGLTYTTPSGRTWSMERFLWVDGEEKRG